MTSPRGPRAASASLRLENLEDRTTPSAPIPTIQVGGAPFAADRVTVIGSDAATLASAPFATHVKSIGGGMFSVRLAPGTDPGAAVAYFQSQAGTDAELDRIVYPERVPNDANYAAQYGPALIGAETAWNITTGNPAFVVGISDSGIDYTHPDLAANIWTNPNEIDGNGIDDDNNGYVDDVHGYDFADDDSDPMDDFGHGTHVAGIVGAVGNNGIGVTGVNWDVKLMALRWLPGSGGATSNAVAALNYSLDMGVKVTNNSWGSNGSGPDKALSRTIARAQSLGAIFVCSAGNIGVNNDTNPLRNPSNLSTRLDNVIATAATDANDQLADFSNFGGRTVTLAAPGVGIVSTVPFALDADGVPDGYESYDGTSMASPQVAGAIALYWGANPTLSYQQVINKLKSSVDVLPQLTGFVATGGRLNVAKMFDASPVPPITTGAPVGTSAVRVLGTGGTSQLTLTPYQGFLGGVETAVGDVNNDGTPDLVTAATLGGHVKVFDGKTGAQINSFFGFQGYTGPINLAVGDLNGDGFAEIVVAANLNGHIKVFDGKSGRMTFSSLVYQGYAGAIAVSVADRNGDGLPDLVTAADGGRGVHIKTFSGGASGAMIESFLTGGANQWSNFSLAAADLNMDGVADLLVSQGPRVRVIDGKTRAVKADFIAFDPTSKDVAKVQAARFTGDPSPEVVVTRATPGQSEQVRVYDGLNFTLLDAFTAGAR